jgi:uncharacterized damage-inducible protein DinB
MSERSRLVDLMRRVHDGDAWHGPSVMTSIDGVDAAAARRRPIAAGHTIWEIALHIVGWRQEVTARLSGKAPTLPEIGDWPSVPDDDRWWPEVGELLESSHRALVAAVEVLADADLERPVGDGREEAVGAGVSVAMMLHGVVHHDAYHAGQIGVLRKASAQG